MRTTLEKSEKSLYYLSQTAKGLESEDGETKNTQEGEPKQHTTENYSYSRNLQSFLSTARLKKLTVVF
jgi:hypothetical protein